MTDESLHGYRDFTETHFTLTDVRIMDSLASFTGAAISLMNKKYVRAQRRTRKN